MSKDKIWRTKLAAWTHDPAEKALVLLRDPAGHEWGTVAELREEIFGQRDIPSELKDVVKKADHWAAAADRPQWPRDPRDGRYAPWTQVRFTEQPVLIHPLSGEEFKLEKLSDVSVESIKAVSRDHFHNLVDSDKDMRKIALVFWRFGPVLKGADEIGEFWGLLPADTRVPDHTIWQHLDLTAAFATALQAGEGNPALLTVSFGPVQEFIAQARTTSDLWAGSHLLARIAWEGLKLVCEEYGPDAVLFPQLRGLPQVDLWLRDEIGLPPDRFDREAWSTSLTDSNPLFSAALPNRFVALVPAGQAPVLAKRIADTTRSWVLKKGHEALNKLLGRASIDNAAEARDQLDAQLAGFPEVHWTVAPWKPLIDENNRGEPDTARLRDALGVFYPPNSKQGFLDSDACKLLFRELSVEGQRFYTPNSGVLYPALYDLLDRSQAAAKSVRPFRQLPQEGYRCSLCGEREWLSHDRALLDLPPGARQASHSLWEQERIQQTSWARKGEHLCALCTLKRLWPNLYCEEVAPALGDESPPKRFVVSTHTMALATSLERWLENENRPQLSECWQSQLESLAKDRMLALPRKLAKQLHQDDNPVTRAMLRGLPLFLEARKEEAHSDDSQERERAEKLSKDLDAELQDVLGQKPEAYYALILMDGDRMGAWLSGQGKDGERYRLSFEETWHPQIRATLENRYSEGDLADYRKAKRPVSPGRHMAVSTALNGFALHIARHVIEEVGKGKLIYAGGDDVLAMISVDDLLAVMLLLRLAYSGVFPTMQPYGDKAKELIGLPLGNFDLRRGHAQLHGRLYRMMGDVATASVGAVVAHHQAPLSLVLRQLRAAEQRAKKDGGRDAFAISLLKRSGGAVHLTCPWLKGSSAEPVDWRQAMEQNLEGTPMGQLIRLRNRFAQDTFSRRAAYITQGWLTDTPKTGLSAMLGYQFRQQSTGRDIEKKIADSIGRALGQLAIDVNKATGRDNVRDSDCRGEKKIRSFIENFLAVAEFLAREGRTGNEPSTTEQ